MKFKQTIIAEIAAVFTSIYSCGLLNLFTAISGYFTCYAISFSLFLSLSFFFKCTVSVRFQTLGLALATYHCFQLAILSLSENKIMTACWGESTEYFKKPYEKVRRLLRIFLLIHYYKYTLSTG